MTMQMTPDISAVASFVIDTQRGRAPGCCRNPAPVPDSKFYNVRNYSRVCKRAQKLGAAHQGHQGQQAQGISIQITAGPSSGSQVPQLWLSQTCTTIKEQQLASTVEMSLESKIQRHHRRRGKNQMGERAKTSAQQSWTT